MIYPGWVDRTQARSASDGLVSSQHARGIEMQCEKVLLDLPLGENALRRLGELLGVAVQALPQRSPGEAVAAELLHGGHVLLCKLPPKNFDDLTDLAFMQISSVGYMARGVRLSWG
jgi:hypothetical protein